MSSIPFSDPEEYRKQFSSAAERNKVPIFEALKKEVNKSQVKVLEVASGVGTHVSFFAERLEDWTFQPSDVDPVHVELIAEKTKHLKNVLSPLLLDVSSDSWASAVNDQYDVVMVSNLLHVSGWQVSIGLFHGCCRVLKTGGLLLIYGPFKRGGTYNAGKCPSLFRSHMHRWNRFQQKIRRVFEKSQSRGIFVFLLVPKNGW